MARIYEVVCNDCGAIIKWCKYDYPEDECEVCGAGLTEKCEPYFINGFEYDRYWAPQAVNVFGVGSTGTEIEEYSRRVKELRKRTELGELNV